MTDIRVMFTIKETHLHAVMQAMQPYATGPFIVGLTEAGEQTLESPVGNVRFTGRPSEFREVDDATPDDPPARRGPGRQMQPDSPSSVALEILRAAGGKGIAPNDFHNAMMERGFERKRSHNAAFFVRKAGRMRKNTAGRFFITREGNSIAPNE